MPWRMVGTYYGPCSCKVSCPCELGEMEGDEGWCSGSLVFDIRNGNVDGTDVGGTTAVLIGDWPSGFLGGNGTGRLYFDPSTPAAKRSALESVLQGKQGGVFEVVGTLVPKWLSTKEAPIRIERGADSTRVTVQGYGELVTAPIKGASGEFTRLLHGAAAFREDVILAKGTGSSWRDPELRQWQSGGHSEQADFDWSA